MLYLDHAATTPLRPEAREAMAPFLGEVYGNPSGIHGISRQAKNAMEEARERIAGLLDVDHPLEIVFTGGGTESDNLAVKGCCLVGGERRGLVTTAIEHEAVLESAQFLDKLGCPVTVVGVDGQGRVYAEDVAAAVGPETALVSVMAANNETGARQPVRKISEAVRASSPGVLVHSDAVQAVVSEELTVPDLGVDLMTLASHKFGGPKGVGVLYVRRGIDVEPVLHGGGQELGRRSGTHNVAGIIGMAAALEATVRHRDLFRRRVAEARRRFETAVQAAFSDVVFTVPEDRLVQHSHFRIPGLVAETLLVRLDQRELAAAAGSACQSGATTISHVLQAMGMEAETAAECLRFTFGWTTEREDGARAAGILIDAAKNLR